MVAAVCFGERSFEERGYWHKICSIWWCWCSNIVQGPYEVFLWKSIRKGWDTFHCFVSFKAGDGSSIKFWQDHWCGGHPPKENFPELYSIEHNKDDSVQSFYLSQGIATIGISVLTKWFKIGSWNQLSLLWIYYILEGGGGWSGQVVLETIVPGGVWS